MGTVNVLSHGVLEKTILRIGITMGLYGQIDGYQSIAQSIRWRLTFRSKQSVM